MISLSDKYIPGIVENISCVFNGVIRKLLPRNIDLSFEAMKSYQ